MYVPIGKKVPEGTKISLIISLLEDNATVDILLLLSSFFVLPYSAKIKNKLIFKENRSILLNVTLKERRRERKMDL